MRELQQQEARSFIEAQNINKESVAYPTRVERDFDDFVQKGFDAYIADQENKKAQQGIFQAEKTTVDPNTLRNEVFRRADTLGNADGIVQASELQNPTIKQQLTDVYLNSTDPRRGIKRSELIKTELMGELKSEYAVLQKLNEMRDNLLLSTGQELADLKRTILSSSNSMPIRATNANNEIHITPTERTKAPDTAPFIVNTGNEFLQLQLEPAPNSIMPFKVDVGGRDRALSDPMGYAEAYKQQWQQNQQVVIS